LREVELRLNPALDPGRYRAAYERDGVVQIPDLLAPDAAEALAAVLTDDMPWRLAFSNPQGRQTLVDLTPGVVNPQATAAEVQRVLQQARTGFAYIYKGYDMIDAYLQGRDPGHPIHLMSELLNTPEFLAFTAGVIGGERPTKTEASATCLRPGDFLAFHDDSYLGQRRAAFTIGFTRAWRPDWGGQLLFHDGRGDIWRGFQPGFNVLTLFKAPQPHSVATVAPYAGAYRLSIVGFLRGDAPGQASP
jgi:SM-20-related protein